MSKTPDCPRCKTRGGDFNAIPDSLAIACPTCGFVWVCLGSSYEPGKTVGQWLEDAYDIPNEIDKEWEEKDAEV